MNAELKRTIAKLVTDAYNLGYEACYDNECIDDRWRYSRVKTEVEKLIGAFYVGLDGVITDDDIPF